MIGKVSTCQSLGEAICQWLQKGTKMSTSKKNDNGEVIPLSRPRGFEPRTTDLESIVLPIKLRPLLFKIHFRWVVLRLSISLSKII